MILGNKWTFLNLYLLFCYIYIYIIIMGIYIASYLLMNACSQHYNIWLPLVTSLFTSIFYLGSLWDRLPLTSTTINEHIYQVSRLGGQRHIYLFLAQGNSPQCGLNLNQVHWTTRHVREHPMLNKIIILEQSFCLLLEDITLDSSARQHKHIFNPIFVSSFQLLFAEEERVIIKFFIYKRVVFQAAL